MATITKKYAEGRKAPYQLLWRENSKRFSRFFETDEERENFIQLHSFLESASFEAILKMSKDTITDVARIEQLRGEVSFKSIWEFWAKHHIAKEMVTTWGACDLYIRNMREIGKPESHVVRVRRILEMFCEDFGDMFLESISRNELENCAWARLTATSLCEKVSNKNHINKGNEYEIEVHC